MLQISGRDAALAVLTDPAFMVPPVPPASRTRAHLAETRASKERRHNAALDE
jgi:hypothetical protein